MDPVVAMIDGLRRKVVSGEIDPQAGRPWDVQLCYERLSRTGAASEALRAALNSVLLISIFFDQAVVENVLTRTNSLQELLLWHMLEPAELRGLEGQLNNPDSVPDVLDRLCAKYL